MRSPVETSPRRCYLSSPHRHMALWQGNCQPQHHQRLGSFCWHSFPPILTRYCFVSLRYRRRFSRSVYVGTRVAQGIFGSPFPRLWQCSRSPQAVLTLGSGDFSKASFGRRERSLDPAAMLGAAPCEKLLFRANRREEGKGYHSGSHISFGFF